MTYTMEQASREMTGAVMRVRTKQEIEEYADDVTRILVPRLPPIDAPDLPPEARALYVAIIEAGMTPTPKHVNFMNSLKKKPERPDEQKNSKVAAFMNFFI